MRWDVNDHFAFDSTVYYVDTLPAFDLGSRTRFDQRLSWRLSPTTSFDLVGQDLFDASRVEFGAPNAFGAVAIRRSVERQQR